MAKDTEYEWVEVETFIPPTSGGHNSTVRVRPVAGGKFSQSLVVECSRAIRKKYPVGTRFLLQCKLTDREDGGEFLYSYHGWPYKVL